MIPAPPKRRILLVDDDASVLKALQHFITIQGYDVTLARSGEEGLKILESMTPDLVLLDISLPTMDGLVILRTLHEKYQQLKVIMMAAGPDMPKAQMALSCGASDYIAKPVDLPTLKRTLQTHLEIGR